MTIQTETITTKHRGKIPVMFSNSSNSSNVGLSGHIITLSNILVFFFSFLNKQTNTILSVLEIKDR